MLAFLGRFKEVVEKVVAEETSKGPIGRLQPAIMPKYGQTLAEEQMDSVEAWSDDDDDGSV